MSIKEKRNFTEGPLFWRIFGFAMPIMFTGILQVLYNMADNIVVGKFSGDPLALGAVGSTSSLNILIVNLLLGISAGTGVLISQHYGAKRENDVSRTVHTALTFALFGGIAFSIIGILISRPALLMMGTKPELIDRAVLYMRIICLGIPASSIYNFSAAILRSVGDSKTPLFILSSTGLVNVILNLLFVIAFHMTVDGVALATIISQYVSAAVVLIVLIKRKTQCYSFSFKKYCFDTKMLKRMLYLGIPTGIQGSIFSISNVLLTSAINTLPTTAISAHTIANSIDAITYHACFCFSGAAMTFTGQNYGANKHSRMKRVLIYSLIQTTIVGMIVGYTEMLFGRQIAGLFLDNANPDRLAVIDTVMEIITLVLATYFLLGIMDVISGFLRGMGYSILPTVLSLIGICVFRAMWVFFVFPLERFNSARGLMYSYPLSWMLTILMQLVVLIFALKKLKKLRGKTND